MDWEGGGPTSGELQFQLGTAPNCDCYSMRAAIVNRLYSLRT
jgi:hypothetical protein